MGASEQLYFLAARIQPLDQAVNFVRFSTGLPHFGHKHIAIEVPVDVRVPLNTYEAMLLGMIQPMASSACDYQSVQLVGLNPHKLINPFVSPFG